MPPRGVKKGTKRARQYEHIKDSVKDRGASEDRAEEITARTVNKERARSGESRQRSRTSTQAMSSSRGGGLRSGTNRPKGRTRDQLYEEAKKLGIDGRPKMNKAQLARGGGPQEVLAGRPAGSRPASGRAGCTGARGARVRGFAAGCMRPHHVRRRMSATFDTPSELARWRSRLLLALALAGVVLGLIVVALTLSSGHEEDRGLVAAVSLLVGWSFIGTGLFAWWRRPANRTGALMTAVGFAWFASGLSEADDDLLFTIGIAVDSLFPGLAGHLLLAFPTGRLERRAERWTVAAGYFVSTVLQVPSLLFEANEPQGLHNLLVLEPDQDLSDQLDALQFAAAVLVISASIAILIRRWRAATPPQRRVLAPVLWTGGAAFVVFAIANGFDAAGSPQHGLELLSQALLAAVPFGFLVGLLRSRLAQGPAIAELGGRLGRAPGPDELRVALADALGDPSLALAYWLPDSGRFVDAGGRPVELPDG